MRWWPRSGPRAPGDKVTLTYLDASGKPQTLQVTLGKAAQ